MSKIVVHHLDDIRAALKQAQDTTVELQSAPGAAHYAGMGYIKALMEEARQEFPASRFDFITDCGEDPVSVYSALRCGMKRVGFSGSDSDFEKLSAVAAAYGSRLIRL